MYLYSKDRGNAFEPTCKLVHDFYHFLLFACSEMTFLMISITFSLIVFYRSLRNDTDFFICRFSLSRLFLWVAHKSDTLFYLVVFRPDPIYKYFWGRQRHLLWRFRGVDPEEDDWRQS